MTEDPMLIDYLLLLRFGPAKGADHGKPALNHSSISRLVRKPISTVRDLIRKGLQALKEGKQIQPRRRSKILPHHIEYLISP